MGLIMFYRKRHCHPIRGGGWIMLDRQRVSLWVWAKELFTGRMGCCKEEEVPQGMMTKGVNLQLEWKELK